jgi:uncharacterized protein (TIGR00297 family)
MITPHPTFVRKLMHMLMGIAILLLTYWVERKLLLYLILAGTAFALLTFNYKQFTFLHKSYSNSWGTLFYPAGVLSAYLLLYSQPIYFFQASLMVLTISDTAANFAGQWKQGNMRFMVFCERKSLYGVLAFGISALIVLFIFLPHTLLGDWGFILLALLLAINFEVISVRGSDNFSITFGLSLFFLLNENSSLNMPYLIFLLLFMGAGAFLLYHWKMLSRLGSLAAYLLGVFLLAVMGLEWMLPVLAFFVTSLIFTKLNRALNKAKTTDSQRNAWQVVANILWAVGSAVLYLITGSELYILLFIAFVAAVTADTWASEIGPVFNKRSFSLKDGRLHKAGTTGAISLAGTLAALSGAVFIAVFACYLFFGAVSWPMVIIISLSAFLATFVDSFLGAFWEVNLLKRNYFKAPQAAERITPNDLVNLLGSLSAALFLLTFLQLFDLF